LAASSPDAIANRIVIQDGISSGSRFVASAGFIDAMARLVT
jgi:hypothetical protein